MKTLPKNESSDSIIISLGRVDMYRRTHRALTPSISYFFKDSLKEDAMKKFNELDTVISKITAKRSNEKPFRKNNIIKISYSPHQTVSEERLPRRQAVSDVRLFFLYLDHDKAGTTEGNKVWTVSVFF